MTASKAKSSEADAPYRCFRYEGFIHSLKRLKQASDGT